MTSVRDDRSRKLLQDVDDGALLTAGILGAPRPSRGPWVGQLAQRLVGQPAHQPPPEAPHSTRKFLAGKLPMLPAVPAHPHGYYDLTRRREPPTSGHGFPRRPSRSSFEHLLRRVFGLRTDRGRGADCSICRLAISREPEAGRRTRRHLGGERRFGVARPDLPCLGSCGTPAAIDSPPLRPKEAGRRLTGPHRFRRLPPAPCLNEVA